MNPATKYTLLFLTLALIAIAGQFVLHAMKTDPRDSGVITDRELRVNVLVPGEHLVSAISVFRRAPIDYFRATRGVLALKGVVVRTPRETMRLGVPASSWPEAQKLVTMMTNRLAGAHASGVEQESMQKIADTEWTRAVAAWQTAQYYTVRRGDALGSIATQWNTTPAELQRLNKLPNNNIRIGQTLLVRDVM